MAGIYDWVQFDEGPVDLNMLYLILNEPWLN